MQAKRRAGRAETPDLGELTDRLRPARNRAWTLNRLDSVFRSGKVPKTHPDGFHPGRLLTTSVWGPADRTALRVTDLWMPWLGKTMDAESQTGVNRFMVTSRIPLKALFPSYAPEREYDGYLDAFPFRNWTGAGAVDRDLEVFKIDYDFEANPGLIRRILDEVVQVAPDIYLGKILFRIRGAFRAIGYFSLREA
jgi:hypothetical protein